MRNQGKELDMFSGGIPKWATICGRLPNENMTNSTAVLARCSATANFAQEKSDPEEV
ncbi:hypothetical protein IX307_000306 [Bacteroides pyogenes]|uniref:hypothetical protein n=1 Tax=Bacteroides pyogenes TaxID=310300 RepID=UPI001BA608D9|nr:hypothetical protein [Bacteroides pyogenes]MBR8724087.1 hypothetical protein [Bacteroides pyogenes]MBR8739848.1 hypothetical protein [Bacteroides pyogenes]MBR8753211.1 hypothetical protein [Bacteroides pyogenes]MBR8786005.1 hypothetical protein [Bacteroides pyogenes]MBR8791487.1 hypothetical protein [Bacteroides pyogenes]